MRPTPSPISCEFDLDQDGKHTGFLRLPHSVHRSAYGWLPIPMVSIKNGDGPTVLLMAGNHGDEYEGQIMLGDLTRDLEHDDVRGRILLLPMANYPAARAGLRTSPIDGGNLNRSFPGSPRGTVTQVMAHYIEHELLARADYLLDLHSGGSSLVYIPSLLMANEPDAPHYPANLALLASLGFPQAVMFDPAGPDWYASSAARRQDCVAVTAEIAGGGAVTPSALSILRRGLYRYLDHVGVMSDRGRKRHREILKAPGGYPSTEFLRIPDADHYCYATENGLFEPLVELGEKVVRGQPAARIHHPESPWNPPTELAFTVNAKVICKRIPAHVERGDCLYELATAMPIPLNTT